MVGWMNAISYLTGRSFLQNTLVGQPLSRRLSNFSAAELLNSSLSQDSISFPYSGGMLLGQGMNIISGMHKGGESCGRSPYRNNEN